MALRVPLKWLQDYVEHGLPADELAERLTLAGLEVESITAIGAGWAPDKVVVGRIARLDPHPDADRLCLATVEYGAAAPLTVVTGAPNILGYLSAGLPEQPLIAPFAMVGAELIDGHAGDGRKLKLKAGKIRGVVSEGMVCSEMELGLSENHEGIMLLPADAPVGAPLVDYLGDQVLEFDIKGGFAHLLSVFGVARETAAITGKPFNRAPLEAGEPGEAPISASPSFVQLEIADPDLCARYTAVLVEGIKVCPSPFWLQQRLLRAGQRPINAVVDVTNYVMLELGQPLHAFDYQTLRPDPGGEKPVIRVRRAKAGERMRTLDGAERTLDAEMLLITDGGGPVAIAGVMGGADSEIGDDTADVMLEAANFEFLSTRRTSQVLKLRTEAGDRFGKRMDPELCLRASLRAARLIAEICGGTVRAEYGDLYPRPFQPRTVELELPFLHRLLGVEISQEEVVAILRALEFEVREGEPLRVSPPSYRLDVTMAADLVEEVARIYGYARMSPTLVRDELPPQVRNRRLDGSERMRDLMTGCGLDEIITYSIISRQEDARLNPAPDADPPDGKFLAVQNPLADDRAHLRRRLLAGLLNTARENLRFQERVALFELGVVFHPVAGQVLPDEPLRLCALLAGRREPGSWHGGQDAAMLDFYDIKGVAETLHAGLEIENLSWQRGSDPAYHPGRSAIIVIGETEVGRLGELHPRVVAAFGLPPNPVCALEIDVEALLQLWREDRTMEPISIHPPILEDLAFIVDESLPAEQVRALIAQTGKPLLVEVALFDLFRGPALGPDKKSLAYALTYQAPDRTLTDKEVAKVRGKIVRRLESELGAVLRGEI